MTPSPTKPTFAIQSKSYRKQRFGGELFSHVYADPNPAIASRVANSCP